jgi:hypothetical protein
MGKAQQRRTTQAPRGREISRGTANLRGSPLRRESEVETNQPSCSDPNNNVIYADRRSVYLTA